MKPDVAALMRLATEKARIAHQEGKLLADLRGGLEALGYRLVPAAPNKNNAALTRGPRRGAATPEPFTCGRCGRSFRLAMHLGRHRTTVHAGKA